MGSFIEIDPSILDRSESEIDPIQIMGLERQIDLDTEMLMTSEGEGGKRRRGGERERGRWGEERAGRD